MDYAENGQLIDWDETLKKFIMVKEHSHENFTENFLKKIFRDMIRGLEYCK